MTESLKREAILSVLARLGDDNLAMLKQNLGTSYDMDLDRDDTYTLEELQIALQRILGANGANLIIREIHDEMRVV